MYIYFVNIIIVVFIKCFYVFRILNIYLDILGDICSYSLINLKVIRIIVEVELYIYFRLIFF